MGPKSNRKVVGRGGATGPDTGGSTVDQKKTYLFTSTQGPRGLIIKTLGRTQVKAGLRNLTLGSGSLAPSPGPRAGGVLAPGAPLD